MLIFLLTIYGYINYKWGVTATPVYQYGMFSNKMYLKDTQTIYKIFVDDKHLDISKYSFEKRDMILISLQNYSKQQVVNNAVFNTLKTIPQKMGFSGLMKPVLYQNNITDASFTLWYKQLIERITGENIRSLTVYQQKAMWNKNTVTAITTPQKLSFIVDN